MEMRNIASLTCGYWNINGHRSKYLGDKLLDKEFLKNISDCDIIGLGEIQSEGEVDISGYICLKQKIREKKFRGPKIAGGVGVYVRREVGHLVELVPNACDDSIWIKIKDEKLYLGTYYVSPQNAKNKTSDFLNTLNEEISHFSRVGTVLVQGDLNARTGVKNDYLNISLDGDDLLGKETGEFEPNTRNSEDKKENPRGKELLDLCKLNNLVITNGRKAGDIFGKYTCHNWNGSSVVDYFLCPASFFDRISKFSVGQYIPWLSDHSIIKTIISLSSNVVLGSGGKEELTEIHPGFLWNEESKSSFRESLGRQKTLDRVESLLGSSGVGSVGLAVGIKEIIFENIVDAKVRAKKCPTDDEGGRSEPWFDRECEEEKKKLNCLAKKMRGSPDGGACRREVLGAKKAFRRIIMAKKRRYRSNIFKNLQDRGRGGNIGDFWRVFRKLSPKGGTSPVQPSISDFRVYFEKLSNTSRGQEFPGPSGEVGPLDYEISEKELEDGEKKLKDGKATGIDNTSNEAISILVETYPKLVLKFFNEILGSGEVVPEWLVGLIVPIHKDGARLDAGNYRGITLMSCLGKLFLSILNSRLMKFVLDRGILSPNQLGFVPGNRTSDAHVIINNLINKTCHKYGGKLFSCFVDFKKAFDSVPRDLLLNKLLGLGINGKFFNIIRGIYTGDRACIKMGGVRSQSFGINLGVRQGCVLSPILFNIFLSDLAKSLQEIGNAPMVDDIGINSLFWADDLVLFSRDEEGLQKMLHVLETYCRKNHIQVNTKKTKCMVFNKNGRLLLRRFVLNDVQLEIVRCYKYLGFMITPSGEVNTGIKDLRDRAFRAFMKIKRDLGASFGRDVAICLTLFDSLIKPILLYASDFWGCFKMARSNPVENLYMSIMKQILGVQKQTTNVGVLLELGKHPISLEAKRLSIKNWERIKMGEANPLLLAAYRDSVGEDLPWISYIKYTLGRNGFLGLYLDDHSSKPPFVFKKLYQRLVDIFNQESLESIKGERSKLRTYSLFKKEIGFETYLTEIKNVSIRTSATKFRLSNHKLMIEVGRHQGIEDRNKRVCPFCPDLVEDESHFLLYCPVYRYQRQMFIDPITKHSFNFSNLPVNKKVEFLMCSMDQNICLFIANSMEIRAFLLEEPKMNM